MSTHRKKNQSHLKAGRWPISRIPLASIIALTFVSGVVSGLVLAWALAERLPSRIQNPSVETAVMKFDNTQAFKRETIKTELDTLELVRIPIGPLSGGGGAIAAVGNHILFATPKGKLGFLRRGSGEINYEVQYTDGLVPMKYAELNVSGLGKNALFNKGWFRTLDMLPLQRTDEGFDLYVSHHRFAETCIEFVVSRVALKASPASLAIDNTTWEDVFVAKPCIELKHNGNVFAGHQAGGRLAKGPGNTLLVTIGDHEFDGLNATEKASMDSRTHLGKLVEINLETKEATIFASGLRNPQGLFVSSDGLIWETEHGPRGGDEVNVLWRGENYGSPESSYGLPYRLPKRNWQRDRTLGRHYGFTKSVFAFLPAIGISSLLEIKGDEFPLWRDDLLVTSLKDMAIWRLRRHGDRIIYSERIPVEDRLRDIQELPNGQLALFTDSGKVIIIWHKSSDSKTKPGQEVSVSGFDGVGKVFSDSPEIPEGTKTGAERGKEIFEHYCASCHAVSKTHMAGPHLSGVVGRRIGSVKGYSYSEALINAEGVWTDKRLRHFLSRPQEYFNGTTMPFVNLQIDDYKLVVKYLKKP